MHRFLTKIFVLSLTLGLFGFSSAGCLNAERNALDASTIEGLLAQFFASQKKAAFKGVIFIVTNTDAQFGGVSGADTKCSNNIPSGLSGSFKAFIVNYTSPTRRATITANAGDGQLDWVLQPNTEYIREDGSTLIGKTNAQSLLEFPLQNSIGTAGLNWTGLNTDWTAIISDCANWSVGAFDNCQAGDLTATGTTALSSSAPYFNTSQNLACVSQP